MSTTSRKRGFAAVVFALALALAPLSSAEAFSPDRGLAPDMEATVEQPASSSWTTPFVWVWERISSIWGKAGASIDPIE